MLKAQLGLVTLYADNPDLLGAFYDASSASDMSYLPTTGKHLTSVGIGIDRF